MVILSVKQKKQWNKDIISIKIVKIIEILCKM